MTDKVIVSKSEIETLLKYDYEARGYMGFNIWTCLPNGKKEYIRTADLRALLDQATPVSGESVAWQFFQDGKWWVGSEYNNHKQNTIDAGFPVRELYPTPQPPDTVPVEKYNKAIEALKSFVSDSHCQDVGGGDLVVTTCESLEIAKKALAEAMKGGMMNTREEFKKWYNSEFDDGPHYEPTEEAWQACQELNDKRISELEEKLSEIVKFEGQSVAMAETISNLHDRIAELEEKLRLAEQRQTYSSTGESNWD